MNAVRTLARLLPDPGMLILFAVALILCTTLEMLAPARIGERADKPLNIANGVVLNICQATFGVGAGPLIALAVNAAGGGLITLPSSGWGLAGGIVLYFVAMDLGEYLFHRAQHAIPAMWAMHSLHHSDPAFGATTQFRHFWLEPILKTVTTYLAVGLIFKAAPAILLAWIYLSFYNFLSHTNVRLGWGRASWLINSPQYHRMHHASGEEYFDCNYASILPIWDVMAGSYRQPQPGEYPATGIDTGEHPRSIGEALTWPWRGRRPAPNPLRELG
jgi:sterol desaturase/sphingolipid hydroxylase (fatty acid hydroxylase superfamily)